MKRKRVNNKKTRVANTEDTKKALKERLNKNEVKEFVNKEINGLGKIEDKVIDIISAALGSENSFKEDVYSKAISEINYNPKLGACDSLSLIVAITIATILKLETKWNREACIVPAYNKEKGIKEAKLKISYSGYLKLIKKTNEIAHIVVKPVYEGDIFTYSYGLNEKLDHVPMGEALDDKITHFYGYYKALDGGHGFIVMDKRNIDKVLALSHWSYINKTKDSEEYEETYVSMASQVLLMELIKEMPITLERELLDIEKISEFLTNIGNSIEIS